MEIQNQVGHRLRGNLSRLHTVLDAAASQGIRSLGRVADRVCEAFDLRDGRGRWQRASCRKALADLEAAGEVSLPAPRYRTGTVRRPRVLPQLVAPAHDVPDEVGALRDLALVRVETDAQRLVWNTLMAHEQTRKAVYLYALEPAWRERLALPAPGLAPLAPGEGLDPDSWAVNEFAGAPLGDARLSARLGHPTRCHGFRLRTA